VDSEWRNKAHRAPDAHRGELNDSIPLVAEPLDLALLVDAPPACERGEGVVGEDEAEEGEEDDEVAEEEQVERAFEVVLRACSRIGSASRY
jgi:hypothetical protein